MTTFNLSSLEGKIAAGLDPHRGTMSDKHLACLAGNIAFLARHNAGPNTTANQISVVFVTNHDNKDIPESYTVAVMLHKDNGKMEEITSVTSVQESTLIMDLMEAVDWETSLELKEKGVSLEVVE